MRFYLNESVLQQRKDAIKNVKEPFETLSLITREIRDIIKL